ncbi:MAG: glycosyltransferase [Alphaproteobacteria bacterium]
MSQGIQDAALGAQSIAVIVPAYNATEYLQRALPPLVEMRDRGDVHEVIVVDDLSSDDTASFAAASGARVLTTPERSGPGRARNIAAAATDCEILWFVDADVVVAPDGPSHLVEAFRDPEVTAVFGSYDDEPPERNFFSQYKNLTHHYYHQRAKPEASTFWAGCGAVRRQAFLKLGGFDIERYRQPSIEDIELGYRMRAVGGRILLLPDLNGTHLKRWTFSNVIVTDIFKRALPWSRLMLHESGMVEDLNVGRAERLRAMVAGLFVVSPLAVVFGWPLAWLTTALALIVLVANWQFFDFLRRRRGLAFAIAGLLFHQLYYVYGTAAFSWCWLERLFTGTARGGAASQTLGRRQT